VEQHQANNDRGGSPNGCDPRWVNKSTKNTHCAWPYANAAVGTCAIAPNARQLDGTEFAPTDYANVFSFRSRHPGGLNFAHADGSVRFLSDAITLAVYRALATIQGGEVVPPP
jgi:prepilin-type processing-associated H-X9-DG protein